MGVISPVVGGDENGAVLNVCCGAWEKANSDDGDKSDDYSRVIHTLAFFEDQIVAIFGALWNGLTEWNATDSRGCISSHQRSLRNDMIERRVWGCNS